MRKVNVGEDFEVTDEVKISPPEDGRQAEKTRGWLARAVTICGAGALVLAFAVSNSRGDYSFVSTVWSHLSPLAGYVLGYYFRGLKGS